MPEDTTIVEFHLVDSEPVRTLMFAAFDLLHAVEEADDALLPDEVTTAAQAFRSTIEAHR